MTDTPHLSNAQSTRLRPTLKKGMLHLILFAALWYLLSAGTLASWLIGIVVVPIATWLSLVLFTSPDRHIERISVSGLLGFIPFFLWQSLRGGWDTARLAIYPKAPIRSDFFRYNSTLPTNTQRLFFLQLVSLLPGTVSAKLQGTELLIHVLDMPSLQPEDLQTCENNVARLFATVLKGNASLNAKEKNV